MRLKLFGFVAALLAVATVGVIQLQTFAAGEVGSAPRCTVEAIGTRDTAFKVSADGKNATVGFNVTGKAGCKVRLSTNSFYAPTMDGRPYSAQILYQRNTQVFTKGTYNMSVAIPQTSTPAQGCYYQLDLTYGTHNVTPVLAYAHGAINNCGTVTKTPHVKIEKTINDRTTENATVKVGEVFNYVLVATNDGEVDLTNVKVTDTAPAGVEFVSSNIPGATVTSTNFSYTIPQLKVGYELTMTIQAKVTSESATAIRNTACVDAPEVTGNPDDCDDATVQTPVSHPAVTIVKTVNQQEHQMVTIKTPFTYEIVVKNTGDVALTNVAVRDTAPAGVTLTGASLGTFTATNWSYVIPTLAVGESKAITLTAVVNEYKAGQLVNTACVDAPAVPNPDGQSADACDDATVEVNPPVTSPKISVQKTVNNQEYLRVGANVEFTYQIVVTNTGDIALTNVAVQDSVQQGVTLISASAGTIASPTTWNTTITTLNVGQSTSFTITAKVPVYKAGILVNTVCVDAPAVPNPSNQSSDACDTASVEVVPPAMVEVCDPTTGTIITVPEDKKGDYLPKDNEKCVNIKVCELATKQVITIKKSAFDASHHSTDLSRCLPTPVTPTTPVITELPRTGAEVVAKLVGIVSLASAAAYYITSRRNG